MSPVEHAAAKMLCIGFPGLTLPDSIVDLLHRGVHNVVLFGRNCSSPEQVASLCHDIKSKAGHPVLISIDQEGGRVQRLKQPPFTPIPSMRALGQTNDSALARELGQILGAELRAVNIDIDFAPVVDVDTHKDNPVIASRSLGPAPDLVIRLSREIIAGLQSNGVASCAKHYLGHGDTSQDSHHSLPRVTHPLSRLQQIEMPPFKSAIGAGVSSIMTAHVIFEAIDPDFPVTLSRKALDGILRDQWNFNGVVFSDDMEMKAIASHFGVEDAMILGANAGIDVFPISHTLDLQHNALDLLARAIESGRIPRARVAQANSRVDAMIARFYQPPHPTPQLDRIGTPGHLHTIATIRKLCDASALAGGRDPTDFM